MRQLQIDTTSVLAICFLALCVVILVPVSSFVIDLLLAFSIAFSMVLLLASVLVKSSTELQSFPVILLFITLLRLALNIVCTRVILVHGHEGGHAAGYVISGIASLIMQGNFVVGLIIFSIIVAVNFIVITKGSGRVAEVAARFTLDALPGKQMSVDADLNSGVLTLEGARAKRREIQAEVNFYGAMDGAAKFVRGDAIAAIVIVFINLIGGTVVGVVQQNMQFTKALSTYMFLSIGEGLVAQISALLVSLAAGILVTKSTEKISIPFERYPYIAQIAAVVSLCVAIVPGIPTFPFLAIAVLLWCIPLYTQQSSTEEEIVPTEFQVLKIEVGYGLIEFARDTMPQQIKLIRDRILETRGIQIPQIQIIDQSALKMYQYKFAVRELVVAEGTVIPGRYMRLRANDHAQQVLKDNAPKKQEAQQRSVLDENTEDVVVEDSVFGSHAIWSVDEQQGMYSAAQVFYAQIMHVLSKHLHELVCMEELDQLLSRLSPSHNKLLQEVVSSKTSRTTVKHVVRQLLRERLSVKDIAMVIEGIADGLGDDTLGLTEAVRKHMARTICTGFLHNGKLHVHKLSPGWVDLCEKRLYSNGGGKGHSLSLGLVNSQAFIGAALEVQDGVIVAPSNLRPHLADLLIRAGHFVPILSYAEIAEGIVVHEVGILKGPAAT
jgi:flagellar biosynthesis protein FlhA